jgi:hypothetical protein
LAVVAFEISIKLLLLCAHCLSTSSTRLT